MKRYLVPTLTLVALAACALARADDSTNHGAMKPTPAKVATPPQGTPAHHKTKCCAGRMQAQPKPPEPGK
jgi:hypothetical protein